MTRSGARVEASGLGFAHIGSKSWALSKVDLSVDAGSELWVTGPNASGKSTLLSILAGIIPEVIDGKITGRVEITGDDGPVVPTMVMQDSGVYLFRSVHEEVAFVLLNSGADPDTVAGGVEKALAVVGIAHLQGRRMHTLSGGERQKVAVAAALAVDPDLLLLDEPFEQLDPASVSEVFEICRESCIKREMTLVVATREAGHVPEGAAELHLSAGVPAPRVDTEAPAPQRRTPMTRGDVVLEYASVTHQYSTTTGVRDVSLSVHAGESLALLGPNGAGKTTLMKHANGLMRPQAGAVLVLGDDIAEKPVWKTARDIGMIFQNPDDQIFNRTVGQEVAWGLRVRGLEASEAEARASATLGELGIGDLASENPHELTTSQRQLVAFASILALEPPVFVLDEPTKALDSHAAEVVAAAVDRRLAKGAGVLLVTHDLGFAARLADRSAVLVDGEVVWTGETVDLLGDSDLLRRGRLIA